MLKGSGPRGGIATVDTYSFPSETDQPSFFFYRRWRFVRSNRDWLGRFASVSTHRCSSRRISLASLILYDKSCYAPSCSLRIFRAGCLRVSRRARALTLRERIKWITYSETWIELSGEWFPWFTRLIKNPAFWNSFRVRSRAVKNPHNWCIQVIRLINKNRW